MANKITRSVETAARLTKRIGDERRGRRAGSPMVSAREIGYRGPGFDPMKSVAAATLACLAVASGAFLDWGYFLSHETAYSSGFRENDFSRSHYRGERSKLARK